MQLSALRGRPALASSARCHRSPLVARAPGGRRSAVLVRASADEPERIKRTLEGLDALLGLDPNDTPSSGSSSKASSTAVQEASRPSATTATDAGHAPTTSTASTSTPTTPSTSGAPASGSDDQFQKIIEKARLLADAQKAAKPGNVEAQQQQLRQEFETLLQAMSKGNDMLDKEDLKRLREAAFGPQTFWVTETIPLQEVDKQGILIRGNLRESREKVFANVCAKVDELFGAGKFAVIMIEDEQQAAEGEAPIGKAALFGPRVAFQIVPAAQAQPPQTNGWRQGAALVLFLLFVASSLQLSLVANITKLPKETLEFFAKADNFNSDVIPPGLENWDPTSYFITAIPIFMSVMGISFFHEVGHRIAAAVRGVKLGPTYFIPNLQLGSFGAITPFNSLLKGRGAMWDVSAAGPLAGGLTALAVMVLGLMQSSPGLLPKELLVPVPTALFQSSLLLGTLVKAVLGDQLSSGADEVLISPLVIAGWCGLVTTALNTLPVGSLDGGRMMQAAYGKQALALSSFFTYIGLGLGLLGSSLSLPFGLYVIICQRTAERYIQDNVTPVSDPKRNATAVAVLAAILILVPMAPEVAQSIGVGRGMDNFF
ncbi:hypothetical protein HYH03_004366 [Edaphochlamys debaryana]|uniref:Peptidase M50 domain-containing protein n=1 Tax=Edaphochlamys debaryana TaxID=47281 RepID=A0A835Y7T6_9CHLO|nr:hypothetical protein HYH03_004366 [Edaphochlamys debaryana]|eukprot:KAG2497626.1 hypothetical protein HYH03_004366 [Edaphochlamys debaryana]